MFAAIGIAQGTQTHQGKAMAASQTDQMLAEEIHEFRRDFNDFRVEVVQKLEALTVRISDMLSVTRWTIGILTPIIVTLIGSAFALTWYVARLDSRVGQLETTVHPKDAAKLPPQPIRPKPAP
jgi:hypothetical protein